MWAINIRTINKEINAVINIETTKEVGEMVDHFLHEGFSLEDIEPEDIMSILVLQYSIPN